MGVFDMKQSLVKQVADDVAMSPSAYENRVYNIKKKLDRLNGGFRS